VIAVAWAIRGRRAEDRHMTWIARVAATWGSWRKRIHVRSLLARIDARTLRDVGIDPVAAQYEATRPFWIAERRLR
jgi:uncharacterized protein YjiS (DUF1127 family)